jgi:hypothetical protein
MKKKLSLCIILLLGSKVFSQMRITEWMYEGTNGEFVEFTNVGTSTINLTGWSFDDNSRIPGSQSLSSFSVVQAGESVIFSQNSSSSFRSAWGLCAGVKIVSGIVNNLGRNDEINLYDSNNNLVDRLTYNDRGIGAVDGPRTNIRSAWVTAAGLGVNTASLWTLSVSNDSEASYTITGGNIGSPGKSTRATVVFNPCSTCTPPTLTIISSSTLICAGQTVSLNVSGASSYTWNPGNTNGSSLVTSPSVTTIYSISGTNSLACVGQQTISINVSQSPIISASANPSLICAGQSSTLSASGATSYTWNPGNLIGSNVSISPSSSSNYTVIGTSSLGCLGQKTISINVSSLPIISLTASPSGICAGGVSSLSASGANTYTWIPGNVSGASFIVSPSLSTTYSVVGSNSGCSNTAIITVTVNPLPIASIFSIAACNSYSWNAATYTTSGVYTFSTTNASGCDSTSILHLTINNSNSSSSSVTACNSYSWNASTYTASGIYTYSTTNISGCDSTSTIYLTINSGSSSSSSVTACNSYSWNASTYTTSGIYTYSTTNALGCDSMSTIYLTINNSSSSSSSVTACNSYSWNASTYTTSGIYTYSTTNALGCDSTSTLYLTINNGSTSSSSVTSCNSYLWNASTYTASGIYTYSTTTISGCDSTSILHLTINNSSSSSSSITACNSYTWNAATYTTSGIYTYSTTNASGCDSTSTLYLTINNSSSSSSSATACNFYSWNASTYTASGIYTYTSTNASGCDSIAVLNLTIFASPIVTITPSDTVHFCTLNPVTLSANPGMNTYLWSNGATSTSITTLVQGTYTVQVVNSNGCSAISTAPVVLINDSSSDFNADGGIDVDDFLLFAGSYNTFCTCTEDLDNDGSVDIDDFLLFVVSFGSTCN